MGKASVVENKDNQSFGLLKEQISKNENLFRKHITVDSVYRLNKFSLDELKILLNLLLTIQHFPNEDTILKNYLDKEFSFK